MKKLFIAATLTLALCGVANAGGTAEDIKYSGTKELTIPKLHLGSGAYQ